MGKAKATPWPNRLGWVVSTGNRRYEVWNDCGGVARILPDDSLCGFRRDAHSPIQATPLSARGAVELVVACVSHGQWIPCE